MFLKGQIGSEALHVQQMTGSCRAPAKTGCFSLSQSPDYLITAVFVGEIR